MDILESYHKGHEFPDLSILLKKMYDNIHIAIAIMDSKTTIVYINPEFTKVFGYTEKNIQGSRISDLIDKDMDSTGLNRASQQLIKKDSTEFETIHYHKDGREINILCRISPIIIENQIIGGFAYYTDISRQTKDKEELRRAYDSLEFKIEQRTRELRESEEKYRALFEQSIDAIILHEKGRIMEVNPRACEILGYSREQLLNMTIYDLHIESDRKYVKESINRNERRLHVETRLVRADGGIIDVEVSSNVLNFKKRINQAVICDITERKQAVKKLEENKEKYRTTIEYSNDGVAIVNELNCIYANSKFAQIYGYESPKQLIGKKTSELIYSNDADYVREKIRKRARGEVGDERYEHRAVKKNGEIIYVEVSVAKIMHEGEPASLVFTRDITERKEAEKRLEKAIEDAERANLLLTEEQKRSQNASLVLAEKNKELEKAYSELKEAQAKIIQQEKMASIGQLAAGVAHEINNPMGYISSNFNTSNNYQDELLQVIQMQDKIIKRLKKEQDFMMAGSSIIEDINCLDSFKNEIDIDFIMEDISNIYKETGDGIERIKKIVNDLKNFAHPGKKEMKYANINDNIDSTINIVWNQLKYKATVEKDYGNLPELECYPQELNQVFLNLLVNAGHAINSKGKIHIKTRVKDQQVIIQIRDTGQGIPEENISKIFEPFFTTKEVGKGTGLGLNLVYNIIKKHNGTIDVESDLGKGTKFIITLPINGTKN